MTTPAACLTSLLNFELKFHKEVLKWIEWKLSNNGSTPVEEMELLDVSDDHSVFSFLLLKYLKAKRLVAAVRGDQATDLIDRSVEIKKLPDLSENNLQNLSSLGRFDVIIVKDTTHETENLSAFFLALKNLLKNDDGRIFILAHPKNPPLPIPDVAIPFWRRSAPNREEIIKSIKSAGLGQVCYAVSCPVSLAKQDWFNILKLRTVHALKQCSKCTDKEIRDFANNSMRMQVCFEEKILIFLITPRAEQGDRMERESSGTPPGSPKLKLAGGDDGPLRRASYSPADCGVGRSSSFNNNNKQSSPGAIVKPGAKADASSVVRPPPTKAAATFFAQQPSQQLAFSEPTLSSAAARRSKSPRKPSLPESEEERT